MYCQLFELMHRLLTPVPHRVHSIYKLSIPTLRKIIFPHLSKTFGESMDYELEEHLRKIGPVLFNAEKAGVLRSDLLSPAQFIAATPPTIEIRWFDASLNSTLLMRSMGSGSFGSVWKV
jgi:hypothetical protein